MAKKYRLEMLGPARAEILEIAQIHMELVGPVSARKITGRIREALERLCTHPRMGRQVRDDTLCRQGYRFLICGNYLCFYRLVADAVFVYHVVDGRRDYPKLLAGLREDGPVAPGE